MRPADARTDSTAVGESCLFGAMPPLAQQPDTTADPVRGKTRPAALSLLFPAGARPDAERIAPLLDAPETGLQARVVHRPDPGEGWLEILASGLTFDLCGLAPAAGAAPAAARHLYGFDGGRAPAGAEAIELVPSGHVAAGAGLQPVVRTMMGLAAALALELPAIAVGWRPAGTLMEPRYFSRIIVGWLAGGAFPALGLTALAPDKDGGVSSFGLSYFIGQEIRLDPQAGEPPVEAVKLAIRVVDDLVRNGSLSEPRAITVGADRLLAEPSRVGDLIWVWRQAR